MERQPAKRIPQWKVNARTQVHKLAKDKLMNFRDLPFQWNELGLPLIRYKDSVLPSYWFEHMSRNSLNNSRHIFLGRVFSHDLFQRVRRASS